MDDQITCMTDVVRFYLRQDLRLKRAGLEPLSRQPHWALDAIWDHAQSAATRLQRLQHPPTGSRPPADYIEDC